MKKALFITLSLLLVVIASDAARIIQTADAGWRPRPRVVQPPPEPPVVLDWEEVSVEYPAAEDGQKESKILPVIKQFDKALEEQKMVVVYVYTDDMRKKYEAYRKKCETFFNDVLCKKDVAEELKKCIRLKLNIDKLDDKKLRKVYKFSKSYPTLYMFDFEGSKIKSISSSDVNTMVKYLKYCEKKVEKLIKKLEKKAEKNDD